jgi:uncharacterized protein YciI
VPWLYLLRPIRPESVEDPTPDEERAVGAHFAHLQRGAADGTIVLAGPSIAGPENAFGLVVLDLEDEQEARALMESDPAITGGVMAGELRPLRLSVLRGRE